jgi:hypothetical protein
VKPYLHCLIYLRGVHRGDFNFHLDEIRRCGLDSCVQVQGSLARGSNTSVS